MSRSRFAVVCSAGALAAACGSGAASAPTSPLPTADLSARDVAASRDEIVPAAAFTDYSALTAAQVQAFLEKDPYAGKSFLATYQSNGLALSAAVARVAETYRISPIVLLVALEAEAGLVAATATPEPPTRADYVFGCGCTVPSVATSCAASAAGLDVQLACYAGALRASLDAIAQTGQTAGGWAPGRSGTTLDGVTVKPVDASTAALYQYDPVAGDGQSGGSLFANIWGEFAAALSYTPPKGGTATAEVGDACLASSDCALAGGLCAAGANYPGGMCTAKCAGSCAGSGSFCADFTSGGFCLAVCNPTVPASCRTGYACTLVEPSGAPAGAPPAYVCTPP